MLQKSAFATAPFFIFYMKSVDFFSGLVHAGLVFQLVVDNLIRNSECGIRNYQIGWRQRRLPVSTANH